MVKAKIQNVKCELPPYKVEEVLTLDACRQKVGWNITAFNLPDTWNLTQGEGVKIAVIDSTPSWSPIICKNAVTKEITILTIEEIFNKQTSEIFTTVNGEMIRSVKSLFVWNGHSKNGKNWQKIKHVIKHPYVGQIKRINLRGGVVDVTPNHSIISANGKLLDAKNAIIGQQLSFSGLSKFNLTDGLSFVGSSDVAWLLGLFAAEGSIYSTVSAPYTISISQNDVSVLEKAQSIVEKEWNVHSRIDGPHDGMYKLIIQNRTLWYYLASIAVTPALEKRVPNTIINAPKHIQISFLKGYNLGDGYHKECRISWEFHNWTTKSQILACGLLVLNKLALNQEYTIQCRVDKENIIQIQLNQPESEKFIKSRREITKILNIDYDGMVYDLETEDHTFGCGVGPVRIHNTGCDLDHPDLIDNLLPGMNFVRKGRPPQDDNQHGTHVTGIIVAENNDIGMVGVAPKAKVMPVKVLNSEGVGDFGTVALGIKWAVDNGADIISMSLGSPKPLANIQKVLKYAESKGIPVFCAAGNAGNTKQIFYPANYKETIAVGSIDEDFNRSKFSNTGENLDFMAPGGKIFSTVPDNWYAFLSGTSMASPFAVGVAALCLSYQRKYNPDRPLIGSEAYRQLFRRHVLPVGQMDFANKMFYQGFGIIDTKDLKEWIKEA